MSKKTRGDLPLPSSSQTRRRMQATPRRDTPCELAIRTAAHRLGLRFRVDWPLPGSRTRADLAFPRARVAVFVDGCFWHGCPIHGTWPKANAEWWRDKIETNVRRDLNTTQRLEQRGWRVLRFWEHEDADNAAHAIAAEVRRTRPNRSSTRNR